MYGKGLFSRHHSAQCLPLRRRLCGCPNPDLLLPRRLPFLRASGPSAISKWKNAPVRPVRNRCVSGPTTSAGRRIFRASPPQHPRAPSRLWIWGAVALSLAVLAAIGLVAFRPTTVTVTPRSQPVVFDASAQFTAYPAATAASGTLSFILETNDLEDSAVVPTSGSTHVEDRASGDRHSGQRILRTERQTHQEHPIRDSGRPHLPRPR